MTNHPFNPEQSSPWLSVSPLAMELLLAIGVDAMMLLNRLRAGDWGIVKEEDRQVNQIAVRDGNAIIGIYPTGVGQPLVALMEANHLFAHILVLEEAPKRYQNPRVERVQVNGMERVLGSAARFPLGTVVLTPGAIDALTRSRETPTPLLKRHVVGDWGCVSGDDKQANERALVEGERLLSSYRTRLGETLWVITEADRESTTLLLPDEY